MSPCIWHVSHVRKINVLSLIGIDQQPLDVNHVKRTNDYAM